MRNSTLGLDGAGLGWGLPMPGQMRMSVAAHLSVHCRTYLATHACTDAAREVSRSAGFSLVHEVRCLSDLNTDYVRLAFICNRAHGCLLRNNNEQIIFDSVINKKYLQF